MTTAATASPLPEGSVLLHIGPQKTGSTAIQMAMHLQRDELARHGVHYAGAKQTPREAGWAVLGKGSAIGRPPPRIERWERLVSEIASAPEPRVCLSNEDFALADDDAAARIVAGTGPDRTHVVFVARRVDKLLPSHWQERVKARMQLSYEEFLHQALDPASRDWETWMLWGPQDVAAITRRWARHLDRGRITIVVADESDRGVLPRAFESLLALPPGLLVPPRARSNRSMSYPAVEALRRVNRVAHDESWTLTEYWRIVQSGIVPSLKARNDPSLPTVSGVPAEFFDRVAERADQQIAAIEGAGVRVIGDPESLRLRGKVQPVEMPDRVDAVPMDLLADVLSGTYAGMKKLRIPTGADARAEPDVRELIRLLAGRLAARARIRRS